MAEHPGVYLFLGPEIGLKTEEIDRIRASIAKRVGEPADEHRFYLPEDSLDDALGILRNGSLFAAHRIVLLSGADLIKKKADIAALAAYGAAPAADATLILLSDGTRVAAGVEKAVSGDRKKIFWEMFENQKRGWLSSYVRKRGLSIGNDAIDIILDVVANNTAAMRAEIDRLCVYVGRGQEITADVVETYVYHSREETVFSVFRYITEGDLRRALAAFSGMSASGDAKPPAVCGGLMFQLRRLRAVRRQLDDGDRIERALDCHGIRGKLIRAEFAQSVERFTAEQLEECLSIVSETDLACRQSGTVLHVVLLELMIYQLVQRRKAIDTVEESLWA